MSFLKLLVRERVSFTRSLTIAALLAASDSGRGEARSRLPYQSDGRGKPSLGMSA
jgi:hypothetical protein